MLTENSSAKVKATIPKFIVSLVLNRTFWEYMRLIGKQQYTKV